MKKSRGFTIIEICVVIVIIGILLSLALSGTDREYQTYVLQDNTTVKCKDAQAGGCGLYLSECEDQSTYSCQTNVRSL